MTFFLKNLMVPSKMLKKYPNVVVFGLKTKFVIGQRMFCSRISFNRRKQRLMSVKPSFNIKCRPYSNSKELVEFSNLQDGMLLKTEWSDGTYSDFHSIWLRHNCMCSKCVQPGSGQRIFDSIKIPYDIKIESVSKQDSLLHIKWESESDHDGQIPLEYLIKNSYSKVDIQQRYQDVRITQLADEIPVVNYSDVMNEKEALYRWLYLVNEYGLCLMKGVPIELNSIISVGNQIGPIQETNYGQVFDVKSEPVPVNIAYSSVGLDLHMDLVYLESPPGLQLLHCVRYDERVEGGDSTYLDVFHVVEELRQTNPEVFQTLSEVPATFQKCHYERANPFHLVYQKPHIILNHFKQVVAVNWAPPFEGPLLVKEEDVLRYYEAYHVLAAAIKNSDKLLKYKMELGDLMTFNNHRMLHGRQEFQLNGGIRHLQGCYVCIDDFKCKVQVLSNQVGNGHPPKHVGNQSWL